MALLGPSYTDSDEDDDMSSKQNKSQRMYHITHTNKQTIKK